MTWDIGGMPVEWANSVDCADRRNVAPTIRYAAACVSASAPTSPVSRRPSKYSVIAATPRCGPKSLAVTTAATSSRTAASPCAAIRTPSASSRNARIASA
ncbi:MAG: hypothetical protein PGN29_01500 [Gordonia paraffinivorans]